MNGSVGGAIRSMRVVMRRSSPLTFSTRSVNAQPRACGKARSPIEAHGDRRCVGAAAGYRVAHHARSRSIARERTGEGQMLAGEQVGEGRFGRVILRRRCAEQGPERASARGRSEPAQSVARRCTTAQQSAAPAQTASGTVSAGWTSASPWRAATAPAQ